MLTRRYVSMFAVPLLIFNDCVSRWAQLELVFRNPTMHSRCFAARAAWVAVCLKRA